MGGKSGNQGAGRQKESEFEFCRKLEAVFHCPALLVSK